MSQSQHDSGHFAETRMVSLQEHVMMQQRHHPTATGEFTWLMSGITKAARFIAAKVRRAGLVDILGEFGTTNVQGETVQKLDIFANDVLIKSLTYRGNVGILASEENDEPVVLHESGAQGRYVVLFDPLDGSSNIDVNISVGTIFSILRRQDASFGQVDSLADVLQPGLKQVAAGYVIYGSSTVFVYTTGHGVHLFTLDPTTGAFILHRENLRMPDSGSIYSVNEANVGSFAPGVRAYLDHLKASQDPAYTSRYVGSFVADFHRTLLKGGIFMYPATAKSPSGKLRLMYEANPMALLAREAGGLATDGSADVLDIVPTSLHQRTPLYIGSRRQVEEVKEFLAR
ncbi:MAG: class 1 fructose-bisphosphatase [Planctomycetota bacterium]